MANLINAIFDQGRIQNVGQPNFSSVHDGIPDHIFQDIVNNFNNNPNAMCNLTHAMITSLSYNIDDVRGTNGFLKYMIPIFNEEVNGGQVNEVAVQPWALPTAAVATLPEAHNTFNGRSFSGYVLAINRLPYHQKMTLMIDCPAFVMSHCGILVNGKFYKLTSPIDFIKTFYNFHLAERNSHLALNARTQLNLNALGAGRRNFGQQGGIPYVATQRQIDWSFLNQEIQHSALPTTTLPLLPKIVYTKDSTDDEPVWQSGKLYDQAGQMVITAFLCTPYDGQNHQPPQQMRQNYRISNSRDWFDLGFDGAFDDPDGMSDAITTMHVISEAQRPMTWNPFRA